MAIEIKLPALGDGIHSGDVLEVLVREGDVIKKDQGLVELETDKATVEVPSTHAGKVVKVHVASGDSVPIGGVLVTVEPVGAAAAAPAAPAPSAPAPAKPAAAKPAAPAKPAPVAAKPTEEDEPAVDMAKPISAAAAKPTSAKAPPAKTPTPAPVAEVKAPKPAPAKMAAKPAAPVEEEEMAESAMDLEAAPSEGSQIPAGPAVRRFAREVGVDLSQVTGSGVGGRITRDDVLAIVRRTAQAARGSSTAGKPAGNTTLDKWGPVRIEKMPKIRRTIAAKMLESATTIPSVTNFDDADVTELERIRQSTKHDYQQKGIKLTMMPFLVKACAIALREHPALNASIDLEEGTVTYKDYYNIGIAIDTDRGLVVPNLRSADKMAIPTIARELAAMTDKVRSGDFAVDDLRGGTFTISNLGAIGGLYSTPIINAPEVAILLVGRSRKMPVVVDDQIVIRLMMPLSLSYDHRLVDGAAAARFLNEVISYLEAPSRILLAP